MCPACGNTRVTVVFEPPSNAQVGRGSLYFLRVFRSEASRATTMASYSPMMLKRQKIRSD